MTEMKSIRRETGAKDRGRTLCVELGPRYVSLWRKGTRQRVAVDYESIYSLGLKRLAAVNGVSVPAPAGGKRRYRGQ